MTDLFLLIVGSIALGITFIYMLIALVGSALDGGITGLFFVGLLLAIGYSYINWIIS